MSYREAQEEVGLLWQVQVSKGGVREITMRHGGMAHERIEEEIDHIEREAPEPEARPGQLVMSTDGGMIQLTSGEWREVKTVAFGEFAATWDAKNKHVKTQTNNISYFSRIETAEQFSRSAVYEWQRRGGENAQRVVAVNDGAVWIQSFIDYHCPQAIRVIDFAHAQSYLAAVGRAIYGAESEAFPQWFARLSHQLRHKPPQRTLAELTLLQQQHPDHPEMATIEQAIRYLHKRQEMIDYPHFTKAQIPIGSGIVESGHKVVMQRRMKQAGMRWAEENINPMLALRMALCNHTWADNWQAIQTQARKTQRLRRLSRLPKPKPTTDPTVISEADSQRLTVLAQKIKSKSKPKRGWQSNRWIFPYRQPFPHRN